MKVELELAMQKLAAPVSGILINMSVFLHISASRLSKSSDVKALREFVSLESVSSRQFPMQWMYSDSNILYA